MNKNPSKEELQNSGAAFYSFGYEEEYIAKLRVGEEVLIFMKTKGNKYRRLAEY